MIVGIDASRAIRARRTGTERYALEIIRHLLALPEAAEHSFRLYLPDGPEGRGNADFADFADLRRVELRYLPGRRLWTHIPMWTHTALAGEVALHRPDVLFVPSHVIPLLPPRLLPPSVVTLHDVGYRHFPAAHTASQRLYLELSTRWSSWAATQVIAPSRATAADLARFYATPESKLRVIYEACGMEALNAEALGRRDAATGDEKAALPLPRRAGSSGYGLYVGTLQPRKNLARLIDAYARLVERETIDWDLVIAGGLGWLGEPFQQQAAALGLAERIHFPGYVDDAELPALFQNARFFAFPSLYEGFGLPVLEAQQMGVAVMTSSNSSLPEVAGDAALLVDPNDIEAIAEAMLRLSRDESLRQELIAAGYENVKRFSWEKAARETLAVLLNATGKK